MRLGKRERALDRARKQRSIAISRMDQTPVRSAWDDPMPRNHTRLQWGNPPRKPASKGKSVV